MYRFDIPDEINSFIDEYVNIIKRNEAAAFVGAGYSISSGFPGWNDLLAKPLDELGIDPNEFQDVISAAQYYENVKGREAIKDLIKDNYADESRIVSDLLKALVHLPIKMFWTTNYDRMIEKAFKEKGRKFTVKSSNEKLATIVSDSVLYKMHGDVGNLDETVLTKDDYERYEINRPLFRDALKSCLMEYSFLFVGFSFSDPNLDYILSRIKILLGDNSRCHYWIQPKDTVRPLEQKYKIEDLKKRYRIEVVLVNKFEDAITIYNEINRRIKMDNIFISGSHCSEKLDSILFVEELSFELAKGLIENSKKIISGFGNTVGSSVINGALTAIRSDNDKTITDYLTLRPFPQNIRDEKTRKVKFTEYRNDMISRAGISIFISGCKNDGKGNIVEADGCIEEYNISRKNGNILIPIPTTGNAAKTIYDMVIADPGSSADVMDDIKKLEYECDISKIVETIIRIIKKKHS